MKKYHRYIALFLPALLTVGCATNKDTFNAQDTPTMKEIYDAQFEQTDNHSVNNQTLTNTSDDLRREETLADDVVDLKNEFSMLPNPLLLMYVPAHLTSGGTPVPGYSTYFSMFEKNHVALPSERRH